MQRDVWSYVKKSLILGFVLFNTFLVVRSNRNAPALRDSRPLSWVEERLSSPRHASKTLGAYLSDYAYLTATDLQAVMFSTLSRTEWKIWITAEYEDGRRGVLPLPLHGERTFVQRHFVDNKEGKFHNNIYGDELGRKSYAYYICGAYPEKDGVEMSSVVFSIRSREFHDRREARELGRHTEGPFRDYFLNRFSCRELRASRS